jgi:hypothetical protein
VKRDVNKRRDGVSRVTTGRVADLGNHPRPSAGVAGLSAQKGPAALLAAFLSLVHAG